MVEMIMFLCAGLYCVRSRLQMYASGYSIKARQELFLQESDFKLNSVAKYRRIDR